MKKGIHFSIPEGWQLSALRLRREPNGDISFSMDALKEIVHPDDVDWLMSHHEDNLAEVFAHLYGLAQELFGAEDPVFERTIAEIRAESEGE